MRCLPQFFTPLAPPTVVRLRQESCATLHSALQNGHVENLQFLVEHSADPTAQAKYDGRFLDSASKNGRVEIQFLVEHGA